jgi:hypothetical protein
MRRSRSWDKSQTSPDGKGKLHTAVTLRSQPFTRVLPDKPVRRWPTAYGKQQETYMAIEARIRELGSRHINLDKAIDDELRRPISDSLRLHELKRQKLRLKEEIDVLRGARAN